MEAPLTLEAAPAEQAAEQPAEAGRFERDGEGTERTAPDTRSKKQQSAQRARQRLQSDGKKKAKEPAKSGLFGFLRRD